MFFITFEYRRLLEQQAQIELNFTGMEWAIGRFFEKMIVIGDGAFKNEVNDWVFKLIQTTPGINLITTIAKLGRRFLVMEGGECHTRFDKSTIVMQRIHHEYFGAGPFGKTLLASAPPEIAFAHELIHLKNYFCNPEQTRQDHFLREDLFSTSFPHQEERKTMTGLIKSKEPTLSPKDQILVKFTKISRHLRIGEEDYFLYITPEGQKNFYRYSILNENAFLASYNLPLRPTHDAHPASNQKKSHHEQEALRLDRFRETMIRLAPFVKRV